MNQDAQFCITSPRSCVAMPTFFAQHANDLAQKSSKWIAVLICISALNGQVLAEDEVRKLPQSEKYIVQADKASVYSGAEQTSKIDLGTLLEVTHHRGPWRLAVEVNGWVHVKQLVNLDEAVDQFSLRIEKNPTPQAFHLRGIAYMALQQWGQAVNDLEEAYALGQSSVQLHLNLGTSLLQLKLYDKALAEFDQIIKNFPKEAAAYQARGDLYLDQGNLEAATADFSKVIEVQPNSPEAFNSLGVTLRLLGDYPAAIDAYDTCLSLDKEFFPALINRGFAYGQTKQFEQALKDFEAAIKLEPDSPSAKNELAWLLATCEKETLRDSEKAIKLAKEASQAVEQQNPEYLDTLAAAYARAGNFEKALETVERAIEFFAAGPEREESLQRKKLYAEGKPYTEIIEVESQSAEAQKK